MVFLVVGLGLVGGSWGLALRKAGFRGRRVGVDCPEVVERIRAGTHVWICHGPTPVADGEVTSVASPTPQGV